MSIENKPESIDVMTLTDQLKASCSKKIENDWRVYFCAIGYGVVAAAQGIKFFILYCGVLVVVFMLQTLSERRTRKQIDLLVQLVQKLERKRENGAA